MRTYCQIISLILILGLTAHSQVWVTANSTPGTSPRAYGSAVRVGSTIYLMGGTPVDMNGDAPVHRLFNGAWSTTTPLESLALHHRAGIDNLGNIVIIAGDDGSGDEADCYVWTVADGNDGGIEGRIDSPAALFAFATDDMNLLYSIGGGAGANPGNETPNSGQVERYDATTDLWTELTSLPTPVADATACYDGLGHILVFGGFDTAGTRIANVARYDIAANTWSDSVVPDMPSPRSGARAVLGADGRAYVIGGSDGSPTASTFILNPNTLTWSTGPTMAVAREHFGAVLDQDGNIVVMGGTTTNSVETLFTPTCPLIVRDPENAKGFLKASIGFDVEVSGTAPFTFQWYKNGLALVDGPTGTGSEILGANEHGVGIRNCGIGDLGSYHVVVTNACGTVISAAATAEFRNPSPIPESFAVTYLHPGGATGSKANAVDGGIIGGSASYPNSQYGNLAQPWQWDAANGTGHSLTPSNSVGGEVMDVKNGTLAGWWWWPYTVPQGTGYYKRACTWENGGTNHIHVQQFGWEIGSLNATDGVHHVGNLTQSDDYPTQYGAFYWAQSNQFAYRLDPVGHAQTQVYAIENGWEYGTSGGGYNANHAGRWFGQTRSFVDMNPPGALTSAVYGAGDGQQVGVAQFNGVDVAGFWSTSAGSFTSLSPAATNTYASIRDCEGGIQVGTMTGTSGYLQATLWQGASSSSFDLHQFLSPDFRSSYAEGIDVAADGTVTVVGYGFNIVTNRNEALEWKGVVPFFSQSISTISAIAGGVFEQYIRGDSSWANQVYIIVGSASGISPGIPLPPSLLLPLNFDFYMDQTINSPNTWIFPSLGYLDTSGRATATATLPAGALYVAGQVTIHHAVVVLTADGSGYEAISNPVSLLITF